MNHGTCIHFNGILNDCCSAGVNYHDAFGHEAGMALRMPCILFMERPKGRPGTHVRQGDEVVRVPVDRRGHQCMACEKRQEPTDDQVQQWRKESDAALHRSMLGLQVASKWRVRPKPQEDRHEVITCPACGGRLHLSQSSVNGHVHGRCETAECVHWME